MKNKSSYLRRERETGGKNIDLCNFSSTIVFSFDSFSIACTYRWFGISLNDDLILFDENIYFSYIKLSDHIIWLSGFDTLYIVVLLKVILSLAYRILWMIIFCLLYLCYLLRTPLFMQSSASQSCWEMLQLRDANEGETQTSSHIYSRL